MAKTRTGTSNPVICPQKENLYGILANREGALSFEAVIQSLEMAQRAQQMQNSQIMYFSSFLQTISFPSVP